MKRSWIISLLAVSFLVLASTASAQTWTSVASGGSIRDNSLSTYGTSNGLLNFRFGATGNVHAVYNVTNPMDSGNPSWTTLEFRGQNPGGGLGVSAVAQLIRQPRFSNSALTVCSAVLPIGGATTATCTFSASAIDFANNYYYVQIILGRTATTQSVFASGVRLF